MFSERLKKRRQEWWGHVPPLWTIDGIKVRFKRRGLKSLYGGNKPNVLRSETDPDSTWKYSLYWQRSLLNKWNSREFAKKYGCRVPNLYWYGKKIEEIPIDSLPEHYVIRPIWGTVRKGIYVMAGDFDFMRNTNFTKLELQQQWLSEFGKVVKVPLLVEEFVRSENQEYKLPTEYKFHTFGDKIAAIDVLERIPGKKVIFHQQLNLDWEPLSKPIHTRLPLSLCFTHKSPKKDEQEDVVVSKLKQYHVIVVVLSKEFSLQENHHLGELRNLQVEQSKLQLA